jgi:hypothetical protein
MRTNKTSNNKYQDKIIKILTGITLLLLFLFTNTLLLITVYLPGILIKKEGLNRV